MVLVIIGGLTYYRNLSICTDNELIVQINNNSIISKNEDADVLLEDFNDWLKEIEEMK